VIADALTRLQHETGIAVDPARRGPVPLDQYYEALAIRHVALPGLTLGSVQTYLRQHEEIETAELGDPDIALAGFLYFAGKSGLAFINADEILQRRRFSAAHELGHFVLHREKMAKFSFDAMETFKEFDNVEDEIEREANHFAAELLMPESVLRARATELHDQHHSCPRLVLTYRLASELLVSREALRYRLNKLGIGDDDES
jgi:Zn-dependent peptidase ImmA (M78 family)